MARASPRDRHYNEGSNPYSEEQLSVTSEQRRRSVRLAAALAAVSLSLACAARSSSARVDPTVRGASAIERQIEGGSEAPKLDHLIPARDSQGSLPSRFEWTAVPGAESYSVGIWNEVDMLVWRMDNIPTNSFARPDSLRLEPGTYFWTISALRGGEEITSSGLAAFVVRAPNP
jgi:hypothetical protein